MFKVNFKNLISENNNFSYFLIFLLVQSFAFSGYMVGCGKGIYNEAFAECEIEDYCADEMELHEVRCCASSHIDGYQQVNDCDTWAESQFTTIGEGSDGCVSEVTFDEAWAICQAEGASLCTLEELQAGCTQGTGCAHDSDMIWTSQQCGNTGGCIDEEACNYDPDAVEDNGSCIYQDCAGECYGNAVEDECGVCNGDGPYENFDCDGNCIVDIDCAGECGGSSVEDECGVCNGNSNPLDCNNDGIDDVCEETYDIGFDTGFFEGQSTGDVNHSGDVNVTDIIQIIEMILSND